MTACTESRGIALHGGEWPTSRPVHITPFAQGKNPGTRRTGGCVDPESACTFWRRKISWPCQDSKPGCPHNFSGSMFRLNPSDMATYMFCTEYRRRELLVGYNDFEVAKVCDRYLVSSQMKCLTLNLHWTRTYKPFRKLHPFPLQVKRKCFPSYETNHPQLYVTGPAGYHQFLFT
jgi:hypothetical protein